MIEDKDLQSLVEYSGGQVLSVYLDTDLADKSKDAIKLMFKDRVRNLQVPNDEIEAIQRFLDFEYDWQSRGLAIFSSGEELWKVVPLPIAVRSQAVFADRPYVRVLTDVLDRFGKYNVALVDREGVRLFSVAWGKIQSEEEAEGEEFRHHKQGGWTAGGGGQRSAVGSQRSENTVALRNLKQAVEAIRVFCGKSECKRLMLAGNPDVLAQVKDLLPKNLGDQIIGEFAVDMEASPNEILSRSLDIAAQVDWEEEQSLVVDAITAAAKGSTGVTGLTDTLYMLHQGRVHMLLVEESYQAPGFICAQCGYVAAEHSDQCPFCQNTVIDETQDVVNLAIHKAVETGAHVNIVRQNEALSNAGGIAAILRY